jgi:ribonuclease HIII
VNLLEDKAFNLISNYSRLLIKQELDVTSVIKKQYNFEVNIFNSKESVKLLVYFGKKGNKAVLQGDKASKLFEMVNHLIFGESLFGTEECDFKEPEEYIGTDESGKGDYFGPLVIAGVFAGKDKLGMLKKIGVKDSKQLSDTSIKIIAKKIKAVIQDSYDVIVINPERYNHLFDKMGNVNRILGWAHAKVLENILEKNESSEAISDKFGDEKLINSALQTKGKNILLHQFTKAERYTAVAAASILAREKFCEWFDFQKKILKIELPKGASSAVDKVAAEIKNNYGMERLKELAKVHFKTTKKILHL